MVCEVQMRPLWRSAAIQFSNKRARDDGFSVVHYHHRDFDRAWLRQNWWEVIAAWRWRVVDSFVSELFAQRRGQGRKKIKIKNRIVFISRSSREPSLPPDRIASL